MEGRPRALTLRIDLGVARPLEPWHSRCILGELTMRAAWFGSPLLVLALACVTPAEPVMPQSQPFDLPDPDPDPEPVEDWTLVAEDAGAAYMSVSGTADDNVWAVGADKGSGGTILHWDGATWTSVTNTDLHDLWWVMAFEEEVVVAGSGGTIMRGGLDGFVREETPGLGAQTIFGLWGPSPDDLWAVGGFAGRGGFIWRNTGEGWNEVPLPDDLPLSASGEAPGFFKIWGRSADDIWVVGSNGTVLHWDGAAFSVVPTGTTELLFTVHGDGTQVAVVGPNTVLIGDEAGLTNVAPEGAGILQGVCFEPDGSILASGQSGTLWLRSPEGEWTQQVNTTGRSPESLHAVWTSPTGARWSVGGGVLSASLNAGVIVRQGALPATWVAPTPEEPPAPTCPEAAIDPAPEGSMARRWNEQLINAIRRDIPRPGVHARNLFHTSMAMWDAYAVYDEVADPYLVEERLIIADPAERQAAQEVAISMAAYRVLSHRYPGLSQVNGPTTAACLDSFLELLGLDPTDTHTTGDDPVAVGNRIGEAVITTFADDGANEAANYADTTAWLDVMVNGPLVVDQPGPGELNDPDQFQLLNLASAETQNGIVVESGNQTYIGAQWGLVTPFSLGIRPDGLTYAWITTGESYPSVADPEMADWVVEMIRKNAALDPTLPATIDISPGAFGNNPIGTNDGVGYAANPATGEPYAPNVVPYGDFARVLAEFWADGPKSETPPGHWNTLANFASDARAAEDLRIGGVGEAVDRLSWDVHLYFALNGALHDAAIAAWGLKRESLGARPISLVRWMAENGQRSDSALPNYDPEGLPLVPGLIELITEESAAAGQRHHHLRWYKGEVAVVAWRGEPGDRANVTSGVAWMRARDWFPYQRRTFVTPAFPGYVSGHSTFSRAGAEVLTAFTGSPWFPGGIGEFTAPAHSYLIFEDGPSQDIVLQWGTYQDAADQAGQSRILGGIHIWPDDRSGRLIGYEVGHLAFDAALPYFEGTATGG
jgi:hypothetical protein